MTSLKSAMQYMVNFTKSEAKKYFPQHVQLNIQFDRDIPAESDGFMRPIYTPDGKLKFNITYDLDLLEANLRNLRGNAIKGLVNHELSHVYDMLYDQQGFLKNPHKNRTFTTIMAKMMKTKRGSPIYRAAMQPDVSTACALKRCKNKIAPAWLSTYWMYVCIDCGYYDAYITDLRAKSPVCERCGSHNLIKKQIPPIIAAKMDQRVTQYPKNYDTDKEMRQFILREFDKYISPAQRKELNTLIRKKVVRK
jgi:predicted SprT family Zn-dependent metalloprotease